MTRQEAVSAFWTAKRDLEQAQTAFDNADQDHIEAAIYRLTAAEKELGIAHKLCKMAE